MVVVEDFGTVDVVVVAFRVPGVARMVVSVGLKVVVGPPFGLRAPFFVNNVVSLGAALPPHEVKPKITTTGTRANFTRFFMLPTLDLRALLL